MAGPIFDTHAHYCSGAFNADRDGLLAGLPAAGVVGICEQATHSGDAPRVLELAHRYPFVYAAIGIHPESLLPVESCPDGNAADTVTVFGGDWKAELTTLRPYFEDPRVVAVGECGLDHHWPVDPEAQYALFEAQLRLALELDKPIIVHDRQAHAEVYALLKKYKPRGILHAYSGSAEDVGWLVEQGMYLGFGGSVTWHGAKRAVKAAAACPLERLVLETDCPYITPQPWKGQRNDSMKLTAVAETLAEIKGLTPEAVYRQTCKNALEVFRLDSLPDLRQD